MYTYINIYIYICMYTVHVCICASGLGKRSRCWVGAGKIWPKVWVEGNLLKYNPHYWDI